MTITFLFTSDNMSLIKFNGKVLGKCHKHPLEFCVPHFETAIVEILPFNEDKNYCNQSFLINNEGTLSCLSPLVKITKFFENNYSVHFSPKELHDKSYLKAVYQQNYTHNNLHHSATIFYDGNYSLTVECEQYMETYTLPELTDITISVINIPKTCFLLKGNKKSRTYIKIIAFENDYFVPFDGYVKEINIKNNKLFITECFNDHMGHCLENTCILENNEFRILEEKKLYSKNKNLNQIPKEVIPYVFIESIKSSFLEDEKDLLTEELKKADINYFENYFGDFTDIVQNPITNRLCLIKKITDNYFEAIDYDFEFEKGKISNITIIND